MVPMDLPMQSLAMISHFLRNKVRTLHGECTMRYLLYVPYCIGFRCDATSMLLKYIHSFIICFPTSSANACVGVPQPSIDSGGSTAVATPGPRLPAEIETWSKEGRCGREATSVVRKEIICRFSDHGCHFIVNLTRNDCSCHTLRESRCAY